MKKLHLLGFIIITILFASCGSEKEICTTQVQEEPKSGLLPPSVPLPLPAIPCYEEARGDADYFRELGIGEHFTKQGCISLAIKNAQSLLNERLSNIKQKAVNCSIYNINLKDYSDQINFYVDADNVCQSVLIDERGGYHGYVVLEVSKKDVMNNIINELNRISKEQNLGIDFSEEKFVNYMNTIMDIK